MSPGSPTPHGDSAKKHTRPGKASSHRAAKRSVATPPLEPTPPHDARHKRVWKACERCRSKKTKCDGENPCKRCKDDGVVCTAGSRKKTEHKQCPSGYAEVLETNVYALSATVQKLYSMVRNGESWALDEPEIMSGNLPSVHDIAQQLGCVRMAPESPTIESLPLDGNMAEFRASMEAHDVDGMSSRKLSADSIASMASSADSEVDMDDEMDLTVAESEQKYSQEMTSQQQQQQYASLGFPSQPISTYDNMGYSPAFLNRPLSYPPSLASPSSFSPGLSSPDTPFIASPFVAYGSQDDCFSPASALALTSKYVSSQAAPMPRSVPSMEGATVNMASLSSYAPFAVTPEMLTNNYGFGGMGQKNFSMDMPAMG